MADTAITPPFTVLRLASNYDSVYNLVQKELNCPPHQNNIKPNYSFDDSMLIEIREQKASGLRE